MYKIAFLAVAVVLLTGCNLSELESNKKVSENIEEAFYEEGGVKADSYYEEYDSQVEDGLITEELLEEDIETIEDELDYEIGSGNEGIDSSVEYDSIPEVSSTQDGSTAGDYYNISRSGSDRDGDNDGSWDYQSGGSDRDLDNDNMWDYDSGGPDRYLDNDNYWDN
ncbi:hypothetical protein [Cytobacillus oceanisediminis]|uniref:Uncharacterized protein n=1 Tax=Cytobacillus oceanisediminis TaxID=665099 RepID=A0ABX3CMP4_9BACI|nr:hypothetical protein [Cytobacillus oceanisediminis]OHX44770.1 hypothetical protein BBV17_25025 [Cytobacillus oceanisediminis]